MKVAQYKCDVCGTEKGINNHWFVVVISDSHGPLLSIETWCQEALERTNRKLFHLCGEGCVNRKVSEFLNELMNTRQA